MAVLYRPNGDSGDFREFFVRLRFDPTHLSLRNVSSATRANQRLLPAYEELQAEALAQEIDVAVLQTPLNNLPDAIFTGDVFDNWTR
jgi:hypothetical protein